MENRAFKVPILYIIFNRPEKTRRSFAEIKKIQPAHLFITADGPRSNRPEDAELCRQTREIAQDIDWPCEVKTLFREKNVGTKVVGPSAIGWFFEHVEQGIILEDDGLPDKTFFLFCEEMLEKYKNDPRIMHISGNNFQQGNPSFVCTGDYYFSRLPHVWGWATWKRAWDLFDKDLELWPQAKRGKLLNSVFRNDAVAEHWRYRFDEGLKDSFDPRPQARLDWDGRWVFTCLAYNGLSITPRVNLVTNIGFDADARIPRSPQDEHANIPVYSLTFPLHHPASISINEQADQYTQKYIFGINRYFRQQVRWFFKSNFSQPYQYAKKIRSQFKKKK